MVRTTTTRSAAAAAATTLLLLCAPNVAIAENLYEPNGASASSSWTLQNGGPAIGTPSDSVYWETKIDGWRGEAPGLFTADAVEFDTGATFTVKHPVEFPKEDCACAERNVSLGLVSSVKQYQYGFFEASVQAAGAVDGITSSFWLQGASGEINIMDYTQGAATGTRGAHCFYDGDDGKGDFDHREDVTMTAAAAQVFGVEWTSKAINFYQDGTLTHSLSEADPVFACLNQPMNIIFSTEVAAASVPEGLTTTSMEVDYFRYWTSAESVITVTKAADTAEPVTDRPNSPNRTDTNETKKDAPNDSATSALVVTVGVTVAAGVVAMLM